MVKEPKASYTSAEAEKEIHFFDSLDAQEKDHYQYLASLSPLQHLENATNLIKRIFAKEILQNKNQAFHITFKTHEHPPKTS